jgi:hypothetical protein
MPLKVNLKNAKEQNFEPLPAGTYDATVFEVKEKKTKGGDNAKLPADTPMIATQFKINDESGEYENRRVFDQMVIPPEKIDGQPYEHYQTMMDSVFTYFAAIGFSPDEIRGWKELPDYEELAGRECRVVLGLREYPKGSGDFQNVVKRVKPAQTAGASSGLASL